MYRAGYSAGPNTAPSGAYGDSGAGFRNGTTNAPPYRQPPPRQQQMTPQKREEVLMAAGRLAAEYLVSKGELPAHVLQNRPPAPLPFRERRPALWLPQHDHHQTLSRPFQQQEERPLAKHHFQFRPPPAWRQFQQQRPLFAPRPFQGQGRPIAKRPRPPFQGRPPFHSGACVPAPSGTGHPGQGAAVAVPAGSVARFDLNVAPAGDCQPVAQSGGTAQTQNPQIDPPNHG